MNRFAAARKFARHDFPCHLEIRLNLCMLAFISIHIIVKNMYSNDSRKKHTKKRIRVRKNNLARKITSEYNKNSALCWEAFD